MGSIATSASFHKYLQASKLYYFYDIYISLPTILFFKKMSTIKVFAAIGLSIALAINYSLY